MEKEQQDYDRGCTISLSGKYGWNEVDERAKKLGIKRSAYVSYAIDREIDGKNKIKTREAVMLGLIILIFFALILQIIGVI